MRKFAFFVLVLLTSFVALAEVDGSPRDASILGFVPLHQLDGSWLGALDIRTIGCPPLNTHWTMSFNFIHTRDGVEIERMTRVLNAETNDSEGSWGCPPLVLPEWGIPDCHYNCYYFLENHALKGHCFPRYDAVQRWTECLCTTEGDPFKDPRYGPVMEWSLNSGDAITVEMSMSPEWGMESDLSNNTFTVTMP